MRSPALQGAVAGESQSPPSAVTATAGVWAPVILGVAVALSVGGVVGAVVGALVAFVLPLLLRRFEPAHRRSEREQCEQDAAVLAQVLALAVAGGATLDQALRHSILVLVNRKHSLHHLQRLERALERGGGAEAWRDLAGRVPAWRGIAMPIARTLATGAPIAEVLHVRAQIVRDHAQDALMTRVRRLGVVLVLPVGLMLMPAFLLLGVVPIVASLIHALLSQF